MNLISLKRILAICFASTLLALLLPNQAFAHASLNSYSIQPNTNLNTLPNNIELTFNEVVTLQSKRFQILSFDGKVLAQNLTEQISEKLSIKTPKLKPGNYLIRYSILSNDGHPIIEAYAFSYKVVKKAFLSQKVTLSSVLDPTDTLTLTLPKTTQIGIINLSQTNYLSGTLALTSALSKAPLTLALQTDKKNNLLIPFPGTYDINLLIRVSKFEDKTYLGKVVVK